MLAFSLLDQAGHPKRFAGLFSAVPSLRSKPLAELTAGRDRLPAGAVLKNQAVVVDGQVGSEEAGKIPVAIAGEPLVALIESLHLQRWKPNPGGRNRPGFANLEAQAADRQGVRRRRPLEVGVEAAIKLRQGLAIANPVALPVGIQANVPPTAIFEVDLEAQSSPALVYPNEVANEIWRYLMRLQD